MASKPTSTVDTTKTKTSTSSKTATANKGPRVRSTHSVFQIAAAQWAGMTGDQRNSYAALTGVMTDALEPNQPTRKNAYSTFVNMVGANTAAGQSTPTTAPAYAPAAPLPAIRVSAGYVNGHFTVTLIPESSYPHAIALKAARPVLAADNIYKGTAFKKIGSIPALSGPLDITALFQTRYRVPGSGYKIALELMGVAPGGYHTANTLVTGVVNAPAAQAGKQDTPAPPTRLKVG